MKIIEINLLFDLNLSASIYTKFLGFDTDVETLKRLNGLQIPVGLPDGTEQSVYIDKNELHVTDINENDTNVLLKHVGRHLVGPRLMDYISIKKIFHRVFYDLIHSEFLNDLDSLSKGILYTKMKEYGADDYTFQSDYAVNCVREFLSKILDLNEVTHWNDRLNQGDPLMRLEQEKFKRFVERAIHNYGDENIYFIRESDVKATYNSEDFYIPEFIIELAKKQIREYVEVFHTTDYFSMRNTSMELLDVEPQSKVDKQLQTWLELNDFDINYAYEAAETAMDTLIHQIDHTDQK